LVLEWVLIGGAIVAASALAGGAVGYYASRPRYTYYYPGYAYYPTYYWTPRLTYFGVPYW